MIIVYEKNGVLYIHRKGRQRIIIPGDEGETIRHFLNKLHKQGRLVYTSTQDVHQH